MKLREPMLAVNCMAWIGERIAEIDSRNRFWTSCKGSTTDD